MKKVAIAAAAALVAVACASGCSGTSTTSPASSDSSAASAVSAQESEAAPAANLKGVEVTFDFARSSTQASNQLALWVEDGDGKLVKTVYVSDFASARRGYERRKEAIPRWVAAAKPASMSDSELDAISSATVQDGAQSFTWDLTDEEGKKVPAGTYRIKLEGTLYWSSNVLYTAEVKVPDTKAGKLKVKAERSEPDNAKNEGMIQHVKMTAVD